MNIRVRGSNNACLPRTFIHMLQEYSWLLTCAKLWLCSVPSTTSLGGCVWWWVGCGAVTAGTVWGEAHKTSCRHHCSVTALFNPFHHSVVLSLWGWASNAAVQDSTTLQDCWPAMHPAGELSWNVPASLGHTVGEAASYCLLIIWTTGGSC